MKTAELFEAAQVVQKYEMTVKHGCNTRTRQLTNKSLSALSTVFMSPAIKKRARALDVGGEVVYTLHDTKMGSSRVTVRRTA